MFFAVLAKSEKTLLIRLLDVLLFRLFSLSMSVLLLALPRERAVSHLSFSTEGLASGFETLVKFRNATMSFLSWEVRVCCGVRGGV